jgi:hypothetical protein
MLAAVVVFEALRVGDAGLCCSNRRLPVVGSGFASGQTMGAEEGARAAAFQAAIHFLENHALPALLVTMKMMPRCHVTSYAP